MLLKKTGIQSVIFLALCLSMINTANAISLSITCETNKGIASRSRIVVRAAQMSGSYFVRVVSGKVLKQSKPKTTDDKGVARFIFDSDPSVTATNPEVTPIPPDYIKKGTVAANLRKTETNGRMGGIRATCNVIR
jgi:hypothetical protein